MEDRRDSAARSRPLHDRYGKTGSAHAELGRGTARFIIERRTGTTGTYAPIAMTGTGTTTYKDSAIVGDPTYCYRVKASNTSEESSYSNEPVRLKPPSSTSVNSVTPACDTVRSLPPGSAGGHSATPRRTSSTRRQRVATSKARGCPRPGLPGSSVRRSKESALQHLRHSYWFPMGSPPWNLRFLRSKHSRFRGAF